MSFYSQIQKRCNAYIEHHLETMLLLVKAYYLCTVLLTCLAFYFKESVTKQLPYSLLIQITVSLAILLGLFLEQRWVVLLILVTNIIGIINLLLFTSLDIFEFSGSLIGLTIQCMFVILFTSRSVQRYYSLDLYKIWNIIS